MQTRPIAFPEPDSSFARRRRNAAHPRGEAASGARFRPVGVVGWGRRRLGSAGQRDPGLRHRLALALEQLGVDGPAAGLDRPGRAERGPVHLGDGRPADALGRIGLVGFAAGQERQRRPEGEDPAEGVTLDSLAARMRSQLDVPLVVVPQVSDVAAALGIARASSPEEVAHVSDIVSVIS